MNCNQLFSSFMMLNEHLYEKFTEYILNGRSRAPPETELMEMLPTFQFGAKTDRRAIQSKFKSWAKRMEFENGCLVLANTGKIIIPKEKCDDLIMYIHSSKHIDIEDIISQIRSNYTWTRKNFGMDRDVVVESIGRNCKREECLKKMRLETAKLGNSFCPGMPNIPVPEMIPEMPFGIPPPLPYFPPYHYPLPLPIPPAFPPNHFSFQIPFLHDMHSLGSENTNTSGTKITLINQKDSVPKPVPETNGKLEEYCTPIAHTSSNHSYVVENTMPVKFKKPKNAHEYKRLMEAVRKNPKAFPKILVSKKNQFLSSLGIAPKVICSTRTLKKFRKELRHKKFMNRECMIYRERKILRDRNKLHKCLFKKKQHTYLGLPLTRKSASTRHEAENFPSEQPRSFETAKMLNREQKVERSGAKSVKLSANGKKKPVEVVTIDSSDEEITKEISKKDNPQDGKTNLIQKDYKNLPVEEQSVKTCVEIKNEEHTSLSKRKETLSGNFDNVDSENSKIEVQEESCGNEAGQNKSILSQNFQNVLFDKNSMSLSKNQNAVPKEKYVPFPQFTVLQSTKANTTGTDSNSYLLTRLNPAPVVARRAAPLFSQISTTPTVSDHRHITKIVYPLNLVKTSPPQIVLIDKENLKTPNAGAYFVVSPQNKVQRNLKIQPQGQSNSKTPNVVTPTISPQVCKLKSAGNKNIGKYRKLFTKGDSSKIDINEEMGRIANWMYGMKSILNPCSLNNESEKSVQKLLCQLDFGIHLVREAKKSLKEIENIIDSSKNSTAVESAE